MFGRMRLVVRRKRPVPPVDEPCPTCGGSRRVPFACDCCGQPLAHRDALCASCLANTPPCYERPEDRRHFSPEQMAAYGEYTRKVESAS